MKDKQVLINLLKRAAIELNDLMNDSCYNTLATEITNTLKTMNDSKELTPAEYWKKG